jgi:hypothetical protein
MEERAERLVLIKDASDCKKITQVIDSMPSPTAKA